MDMQTEVPASPALQIGSEAFAELLLEAIVSPHDPRRLCLETWDGFQATTMESVMHNGVTYSASAMAPGLMQAVHFPPASKPFSSAKELGEALRQFFARYAFLLPDTLDLLVAFVLASWFVDCVGVAPVLYLVGPENVARLLLRLLACLCHRPVLLGDVDLAALSTLPARLGVSLLVDQRHLSRGVMRALRASNHRDFNVTAELAT